MWNLQLGGVQFQAFEVPEVPDHFGGYQTIVVHEFPGGIRTAQTFGAFPPKSIKWTGAFFQGDVGNCQDRVNLINGMRVGGQLQTLQCGPYTYSVLIHEFQVHPKNEWWQPYTIELIPLTDMTASSATSLPPVAPIQTINQGQSQLASQVAGQQAAGPAPTIPSGTPIMPPSTPANNTTLPPLAPPGTITTTLPPSNTSSLLSSAPTTAAAQAAVDPVNDFLINLNAAIQNAMGNVSNISTPALQGSLVTAQAAVAPLQNSPIGTDAAFGLQTSAILDNIATAIAPAAPTQTTINVINPNLQQLALQYYGDASLWETIAEANGLLPIPFPAGVLELVIPSITP